MGPVKTTMDMNQEMNLTNYHSHSLYCDGRAGMESFVKFALGQRFTSYGFSSHAPLPFPTAWTMEWDRMDDYLDEVRRLRERYGRRIELYVGLEIDYLGRKSNPSMARFRELPLDYRIGSVHMLTDTRGRLVDIDVPAPRFSQIVADHFGGDLDRVIRLYYDSLMQMTALGGFDIVGHIDKIHYNASCCRQGITDEPWYDDLVRSVLRETVAQGYQIEINTKAWADHRVFFPDERHFGYLHRLGARVQVNSDAHYPERINYGRQQALQALKRAGHTSIMECRGGVWTAVPLATKLP